MNLKNISTKTATKNEEKDDEGKAGGRRMKAADEEKDDEEEARRYGGQTTEEKRRPSYICRATKSTIASDCFETKVNEGKREKAGRGSKRRRRQAGSNGVLHCTRLDLPPNT